MPIIPGVSELFSGMRMLNIPPEAISSRRMIAAYTAVPARTVKGELAAGHPVGAIEYDPWKTTDLRPVKSQAAIKKEPIKKEPMKQEQRGNGVPPGKRPRVLYVY